MWAALGQILGEMRAFWRNLDPYVSVERPPKDYVREEDVKISKKLKF